MYFKSWYYCLFSLTPFQLTSFQEHELGDMSSSAWFCSQWKFFLLALVSPAPKPMTVLAFQSGLFWRSAILALCQKEKKTINPSWGFVVHLFFSKLAQTPLQLFRINILWKTVLLSNTRSLCCLLLVRVFFPDPGSSSDADEAMMPLAKRPSTFYASSPRGSGAASPLILNGQLSPRTPHPSGWPYADSSSSAVPGSALEDDRRWPSLDCPSPMDIATDGSRRPEPPLTFTSHPLGLAHLPGPACRDDAVRRSEPMNFSPSPAAFSRESISRSEPIQFTSTLQSSDVLRLKVRDDFSGSPMCLADPPDSLYNFDPAEVNVEKRPFWKLGMKCVCSASWFPFSFPLHKATCMQVILLCLDGGCIRALHSHFCTSTLRGSSKCHVRPLTWRRLVWSTLGNWMLVCIIETLTWIARLCPQNMLRAQWTVCGFILSPRVASFFSMVCRPR